MKSLFFLILKIGILRQRTKSVEVKRYCVTLLDKFGSFEYTRKVLSDLNEQAREEIERLGGNPHLVSVLDELLSWKKEKNTLSDGQSTNC